ncbi:MAG: response regulator [Nitrospiraceae bacterium]|nr:response regulator [Nitrospiraceae bacterium]
MNDWTGSSEPKEAQEAKKVVLVIDNKVKRQFYTSIHLQRMDYDVITARTAEDAMLFLELTVPLAVITNYDLPAMNGLVLLQYIKESERTRNVPVIMYTSNRDPSLEKACREFGCAGFLRNPCTLDELYAAVQSAAAGRPRKFVRLSTRLEVVVEDIDEDRLDFISDLSEDGMFVSTTKPLPYGSTHTFTFHLPNAPGWVFRVQGQILHQHLGAGSSKRPGMGVQFRKIGDREREFLKDFIRKEMTGELAPE